MWLQVITLAEVTDGAGKAPLSLMLLGQWTLVTSIWGFSWPKIAEPDQHQWFLWQKAIWQLFRCMDMKHYVPLGMWYLNKFDWHWLWNSLEQRLFK